MTSGSASRCRLVARARALNPHSRPKYTAFAPFSTAAVIHSRSPAGASSSRARRLAMAAFFGLSRLRPVDGRSIEFAMGREAADLLDDGVDQTSINSNGADAIRK